MRIRAVSSQALQVLAFFCAAQCVIYSRAHADGPGKYVLESLGGEKLATIDSGKGPVRATDGMELHPGDRIRTGFKTSAKIVYPDGTKALIGRSADVTIGQSKDGIQYNDVETGEIRAKVNKPDGAGDKKIHFIIHTKTIVMGVRGTDFLFKQDARKIRSDVWTFEGKVDLSHSEDELQAGKGVSVGYHMTSTATPTMITPPRPFEPKLMYATMSKEEPELHHQALSDAQVFREDYPEPFTRGLRWFSFQLNGLFVTQASGGSTYTGELSWNPNFAVTPRWSVRGHVGGFVLKGRTLSDQFVGIEAAPLLGFNFKPWLGLEAGPGVEAWLGGHGDPGLLIMSNLYFKFRGWGWLDRLFLGFSDYLTAPNGTVTGGTESALQFKAGIGIAL